MPVIPQQIRHIATLARLNLSQSEVASLVSELSAVLDYVNKLQQVSLAPGLPRRVSTGADRTDTIQPSLTANEALRNAPKREGDFFIVPKVIG